MDIRFWGVRGSIASSSPRVARIGGNTACLEVVSQGQRLILDAGTGIRGLGESLMTPVPLKTTLLFSHLHWDHVQGFPFFTPAYVPSTELTLYGPGRDGDQLLRSVLSNQMEAPSFPVPFSTMRSTMTFRSALPNQVIETGPFRITPLDLPHPQGCLGYLIEADGRSFAYCTDVELNLASMSADLGDALEGVDALVLDAQYTPDEYRAKRGWGHSTMIDAAHIARETGAGRLFLFHHDPAHTDEQVDAMSEAAKQVFPLAEPAREGLIFTASAAR